MKQAAGWVIVLVVMGGLVAMSFCAYGWSVASLGWGAGVIGAALLMVAVRWIVD